MAKTYNQLIRWLFWVDWAILILYSAIWMQFNIVEALERLISYTLYMQILFLTIVFSVGYLIIRLPLVYWWRMILPAKYGLSVENPFYWLFKYFVFAFIALGRNLFVITIFFMIVNRMLTSEPFIGQILIFAYVGIIVNPYIFMDLYLKFSPKKPLSLFYLNLDQQLRDFSKRIGFPVKTINIYETGRDDMDMNAYAYPGKSTVSFGSKLIKSFSTEEIEAIYAHEVGHLKVGLNVKYQKVLSIYFTFVHPAILVYFFALGVKWFTELQFLVSLQASWFPVIYFLVSIYYAIQPLFYGPIRRRMEFVADEFAGKSVNISTYISALLRLTDLNLGIYSPRQWNSIFSEPTMFERVERLKKIQESQPR